MTDRNDFERALEDVFEDRAPDFSSQLRELLEQLWLEGVRQGRALERLETHDLERALELSSRSSRSSEFERPAAELSNLVITSSSSSGRTLGPGELTLEMITDAVNELERRHPRVRQLPRTPSFGLGALEERVRLEGLARDSELLEMRARFSSSSRWESGNFRQEIMGTWSGSSDECPSKSQTTSSRSSGPSSTPASSTSSATPRGNPGTSGKT